MEQESDHSNSGHSGDAAAASAERVRALIVEKDQLVADLAEAKLAIEASEREIVGARQKIQELTAQRDQLAGENTQARSAIEIAERDVVAIRSQVQELTAEKNRLAAAKEKAQADAASAQDKLRALDVESIFGFIQRRYFSRKWLRPILKGSEAQPRW